jgi:hypothetical protein
MTTRSHIAADRTERKVPTSDYASIDQGARTLSPSIRRTYASAIRGDAAVWARVVKSSNTMKTNTYEARLIAGLISMGWTQDLNDRSRYSAFVKAGHQRKLFVGPNGALRSGHCASQSGSIGDSRRQSEFYLKVLAAGDAHLTKTQTSSRVDLTPYA